jgi:GPI mannosyltransferase 3
VRHPERSEGSQPTMQSRILRSLAALGMTVALAQIFLLIRFFGFLTGDDVEILAEAFRRAIGFHYQPWNIRNLFVPDFLVAPFVFIAGQFTRDPAVLIDIGTLPFIALSVVTIWLVYRLGLRWSGDELAAIAAASLFALHWIPLGFGSTTYPRTLAAACIVAAALVVERFPSAAGALAGIAFADRFSEVIFLVPVILSRADGEGSPTRLRRGSLAVLGTCVSITLTVGLYDWITWGAPFSSVIKFAHLTLVAPDFASRIKYQSPLWYFVNIHRWFALTLLPLVYLGRKSARWSFIVIPLLALSIVRHKELRYLQTVLPFVMIAAGAGFAILYRRQRTWAVALLVASLIWDLHGLRYFAHKSMPAVMAARVLGADARVNTVVVSQLWAYGDRLYFGDRMAVRDVGTPPRDLDVALRGGDAAALYESDFDDPSLMPVLTQHGFAPRRTFRDGPARAVVVFRPQLRPFSPLAGRRDREAADEGRSTSASGTSDRERRSGRRRGS